MNNLILATQLTGLEIALVVVSILLVIAFVWAVIAKIVVAAKYVRLNKVPTSNGITGENAARLLLNALNMPEVEIEKMKPLKSAWFGNSYSARKKTIRLRSNIAEKDSITSVALSCQKVGLAYQHKTGDKKFKVRAKLEPIFYFAPFAIIPLIIIGVILDLVAKTGGLFSTILTGVAFVYFVAALVVQFLIIPTEIKAGKEALELIQKANIFNETEVAQCKAIYRAYKIGYIAEFVYTILYVIAQILRLLIEIAANKK